MGFSGRALIGGLIVLSLVGALIIDESTSNALEEFISGFGALAVPAYAVIFALSAFILYAPTAVTIAGGAAFGWLIGGLLTWVVSTIAALPQFFLARKHGKKWVANKASGNQAQIFLDWAHDNAFKAVLFMRLVPVLPYEGQNYIAGTLDITPARFMLATLLGVWPSVFAVTYFGSRLHRFGAAEFWLAIAIVAVVYAIPTTIFYYSQKRKPSQ
jgi:uncharacterized membrane protein YdjX (TVP38/TMEM64 family)